MIKVIRDTIIVVLLFIISIFILEIGYLLLEDPVPVPVFCIDDNESSI